MADLLFSELPFCCCYSFSLSVAPLGALYNTTELLEFEIHLVLVGVAGPRLIPVSSSSGQFILNHAHLVFSLHDISDRSCIARRTFEGTSFKNGEPAS